MRSAGKGTRRGEDTVTGSGRALATPHRSRLRAADEPRGASHAVRRRALSRAGGPCRALRGAGAVQGDRAAVGAAEGTEAAFCLRPQPWCHCVWDVKGGCEAADEVPRVYQSPGWPGKTLVFQRQSRLRPAEAACVLLDRPRLSRRDPTTVARPRFAFPDPMSPIEQCSIFNTTGKSAPRSVQALAAKIFLFTRIPIFGINHRIIPPARGTHHDRHEKVGRGCDGRCWRQREFARRTNAPQRTAKSWVLAPRPWR